MKKIVFIFLLLGAFTQAAQAQEQQDGQEQAQAQTPYNSGLRVSVTDNSPITIALDGRYFHNHGSVLTVGDLPPGKHYLKIYSYTERSQGAYASLLFEGRVRVEDGAMTNFVLDPNSGSTNITTDSMGAMPPENGNNPGNVYNGLDKPYPMPAGVQLIGQDKIDQLKVKADKQLTDTGKMKLMKAGLKGQSISTDQVRAMMAWFEFESSKVEFAKWAYAYTADKPNYRSLESQFQYKRSQDNLDKFITDSK